MGNVSHGPSIVTDGLVLCLDNYNEQSYLGQPTTNLVPNGDFVSYTGGLPTGWTGYNSNAMMTAVTTDLPNGKMGLVMQAGPTWPTDSVCGVQVILGARTSGQTETVSFWYRILNTNAGSGNFWCGTWNYPDTRDVIFSSSTNTTWTYFSKQITWNTDNSTRYYRFLTDVNNLTGTGFTMQLYQVQFETNSQATKFVNGTRSATDGWQDLSGNDNHADLTQVSYSATNVPGTNVNEFSFDGTDDYAQNISNLNTIDDIFASGGTIEMAVNSTDGEGNILTKFHPTGWYCQLHSPSGGNTRFRLDHDFDGSTSGSWRTGHVIPVGEYTFITATYNRDSISNDAVIYINGISTTVSELITPAGTAESDAGDRLTIGKNAWSDVTYFEGKIDIVRLYNRTLSAAEVLRNYNANKGRYGL